MSEITVDITVNIRKQLVNVTLENIQDTYAQSLTTGFNLGQLREFINELQRAGEALLPGEPVNFPRLTK